MNSPRRHPGGAEDFYSDLGLAALISPLRLRGMSQCWPGSSAIARRSVERQENLKSEHESGTASSARGAALRLPSEL